MAQSYFAPSHGSQALNEAPTLVATPTEDAADKIAAADNVQDAYIEQKDRLVNAIVNTRALMTDLRDFNGDEWTVRYPRIAPAADTKVSDSSTSTKHGHLRRSLSFADEPSALTEVVLTPNKNVRAGLQRSVTLSSIAEGASVAAGSDTEVGSDSASEAETLIDPSIAADFRVLRLDLKLGAPGSSSSANTAGLVSQLEKTSIANLLDERIASAISHIDNLRVRVEDTSSKVLVTGDLNAGKSTFVNALLGREVMPVDQQPCTTLFCEVHDSARENDGVEEVHVVQEGVTYDRLDESTFDRLPIEELDRLVAEHEEDPELSKIPIKLYVSDPREPTQSLLNNGVVDISLIDAPGLNRDSLKTTALFARQSEIDVVVFVVSAENHFTLSAKEFLWNASNEKAYLFIVVNRFDQIRDKAKCRKAVLEQIRQLSPHTYDEKEDLVHFVDSSSALAHGLMKNGQTATAAELKADPAFTKLESDLRSFVLVKRAKSKLLPASTYLSHILSDLDLLSSSNAILAQSEIDAARATLELAKPILAKMQKGREGLEESLEEEEDSMTREVGDRTRARLERAIERVGKGEIGVTTNDLLPPGKVANSPSSIPTMPSYPGLLRAWEYTRDVRMTLLKSLDVAVKLAEDEARVLTSKGVKSIADLGEVYLPEGVERSKRVFMPEAMFVPRLSSALKGKHSRSKSAIVAGGTQGLGLGLLTARPDLTEVTFVDILDLNHHIVARFNDFSPSSSSKSEEDDQSTASALSTLGLGIGAITMVGGKTIGARGLLEGVVRLNEVLGNEGSRKWIAPVVGAATLGMVVYLVLELPNTIPRTVGRRIKAELISRPLSGSGSATEAMSSSTTGSRLSSSSSIAELPFAQAHPVRIGRETRKVLRLGAWDLKERFRGALEERTKEVNGAEESEKKAMKALKWFEVAQVRAEGARVLAGLSVVSEATASS